jgi:hypothetical protein
MMNKVVFSLMVFLTATVLGAWPTVAQRPAARSVRVIQLQATEDGAALDAQGRAATFTNGSVQGLSVQIGAEVRDRTTLAVWVHNGDDWFLAGTITMALGGGQLFLSSAKGVLPEGVDPVSDIQALQVADADGMVLLEGEF